ncbi:hypothetical protein [Magnetovibrio sp.]|uniref:hypothetical protein n=1 Tax=Magnetovibrio sp. TaxID=2024836 RepID=UPI002F942E8C
MMRGVIGTHLKAYLWSAALVVAFCCSASAADQGRIASQIEAAVQEQSFPREVLGVVDNLIEHDAFLAPRNRMAGFDALFKAPSALPDTFPALVGQTLADTGLDRAQWMQALQTTAEMPQAEANCPVGLDALADWYVDALTPVAAGLGDVWQRCQGVPGGCLLDDGKAVDPTDETRLRLLFDRLGQASVDRAIRPLSMSFLSIHQRLTICLRQIPASHVASGKANRRATPLGDVVIGTLGPDVYAMDDIFLVIDPGGNDRYGLTPPQPSAMQTIIDLGGDDTYQGSNLAVLSAAAILDMAGQDRYESPGSGQAAALGGMALLVDASGDDLYTAGVFAQGAAAFGVAALIDAQGRDGFELIAMGQGYGATQGVGVLWDLGGNDTYKAEGLPGAEASVGGQSWAQGVGRGLRTGHGGGTGLLLDDAGDDLYSAKLFAQGSGYYYGVGMLHDVRGDDRYDARRYAQGAGTHMALGLLRDEAGNDAYSASIGVSQGMGLDTAIGVLHDVAGDDTYVAGALAQGASTANGIGMALDLGGADRFELGEKGWGQGHTLRRLPGTAFLIGAEASDRFVLGGVETAFSPLPRSGPHGLMAPYSDTSSRHDCPSDRPAAGVIDALAHVSTTELLSYSAPRYGAGDKAVAAYFALAAGLPQKLGAYISAVPNRDFAMNFSLREVVRCWLPDADDAGREQVRQVLSDSLNQSAPSSRPWLAGTLLPFIPGTLEQHRAAIESLSNHPACSARAMGLDFAGSIKPTPPSMPVWLKQILEGAQSNPCWRLQAAISALQRKYGHEAVVPHGMPDFSRP